MRLQNPMNNQCLSEYQIHERSPLEQLATGNWTFRNGRNLMDQILSNEGQPDWEEAQDSLRNRNGSQLSWCQCLVQPASTTDGILHQVGVLFSADKKRTKLQGLEPGSKQPGGGQVEFSRGRVSKKNSS